ncbi:Signal-induced proliferation-associated 1-like protein 2 [Apophysomyces ossiformis]|uniref:Signal-induced proliferation-associated 1-like protein 2 n=1 Tax=Apophysomyces ossiformis TaxID=679940 RepID=A0A8H7BVJ9_9FUNG|nr:Signal-induced proliferation-associated 1-like protein 2 [Apophysomyces ossiformis]
MTHPPTVGECSEWVTEHCATLLASIATTPYHVIQQDVSIALDSTRILINALDAPTIEVARLSQQLSKLRAIFEGNTDGQQIKIVADIEKVLGLQDICKKSNAWIPSQSFVKPSSNYRIEQPKIIPQRYTPADYASMWPDQVDAKASWFRRYFVGKPYITLIGPQKDDTYVIISVVREYAKEFCADTFKGSQYRIIVRGKEPPNRRDVVRESEVKETEARLEALGQSYLLDSVYSEAKRKPLRSLSSAFISGHHSNLATKHLRAAVLSKYPDLDLRTFKELAAEATILAGLEKEFLRFDEIGIPRCYKFGILTVRDGQETEEEWFSNSGLSREFEHFLNIIGTRVELKDYKGYAAGLDTKSRFHRMVLDDSMLNHVHNIAGESGDFSYMSSWNEHEIMFHVAPLMPPRHDKQQVHRKRGKCADSCECAQDIVCVVFVEGGKQTFDPSAIRSQFLHVYIVVHPEMKDGKRRWRVEVVYNDKVGEFGPKLGSPPLLYEDELRGFLILKLINAENAALKSDKFAIPNTKARRGILKTLVETGLEATNVTRSFSTSRLASEDNLASKSRAGERPKSAGAQRSSRGSLRSLRAALESPPRSMTPDLPPMPTSSRSSVLRDIKSLTRRRSSGHTAIEEDLPKSKLTNGSEEKEQNINRAGLSSFKDQPQPSVEPNQKSTAMTDKGIRSRAQSIMTSVMGRRPSRTSTTGTATLKFAAAAGGITRSRTFLADHSGRLIQGSHEDIQPGN